MVDECSTLRQLSASAGEVSTSPASSPPWASANPKAKSAPMLSPPSTMRAPGLSRRAASTTAPMSWITARLLVRSPRAPLERPWPRMSGM